ncbi:2-amino-4-hydroxy-6-hydroxymethyldihydropteridine diphosphokinase [Jiulongibacter sediminis]|uniref:2-amino-4-hydroxy-6- hydroxymethyldihydropteridine diphosphokinase n=1 Tax=Jiulongibacter sediminis TaxID=1605367 RepID=UPI0026F20BEC|nr:2-amino-4-hydroxy-6-hydroxymethyldihydropteridine diphosphokinase [Jiulongibacter sediminis]
MQQNPLTNKKHRAFLALGSNLGDRQKTLLRAVELIERRIGQVSQKSSVIETPAWGVTDLPDYLNQVLEVYTELWPLDLIKTALEIENELGRERKQKWGSRSIDIDILYFNDWHFSTPGLIIPHPFIAQRDFVLRPLCEIAPDFEHPVLKQNNFSLFSGLKHEQ